MTKPGYFTPADGILCPLCRSPQTTVKDSRPRSGQIRRRRSCDICAASFTTYESLSPKPIELRGVYETKLALTRIISDANAALTKLEKVGPE